MNKNVWSVFFVFCTAINATSKTNTMEEVSSKGETKPMFQVMEEVQMEIMELAGKVKAVYK